MSGISNILQNPVFWIAFAIAAGSAIAFSFLWMGIRARKLRKEVQLAEEKYRKETLAEAERAIKEGELKAKERYQEALAHSENEFKSKRQELQKGEERLAQREETIEKKLTILDSKELDLSKREKWVKEQMAKVEKQELEYKGLIDQTNAKLEAVAHYSKDQAKKELISSIEWEAKQEAAKLVKKIEEESKQNAEQAAKRIITLSIQRYAGEHVGERSVSNVQLPNDAMKGRIIGREGRNIRALEQATGVDVIIDDTPDVVILSAFNPVRREIAKRSLERLIADGRIHPPRIEEMVQNVSKEVEKQMIELGKKAAFDLGLHGIHPELLKLVGALNFRTSYSQNQFLHAQEVAYICGMMAAELGEDQKTARRAGLLHDIGKAMDHEVEGSHAIIGSDFARKHGEPEPVWHAIAAHHEDVPQQSILDILVQASDCLSGARPGARREALDNYIKRLEDLERISTSFPGVDKAYAIQAGREVRIIVASDKVTDQDAVLLSRDIARKIESEIVFPGEIRVTVIREVRAVEVAH